jgi:DNA repair protein SbcC/Rad50
MHLDKLVMRNFKKYRRAEVEFQDGLTGIVGSNGSGKSTIVEAIAWALYGSRAAGLKREYMRNTMASDADSVEIRLTLSLGSREVVIYRAIKGKSLMPEAVLLMDGRRIAWGSKEVDQKLEEILKISYQDFMKTFYARQKDLDNLIMEGGAGKREYLLKLLGLDSIKENALEQIKSDKSLLERKKSQLEGALAEIGDVEAKLAEAQNSLSLAEKALADAECAHLALGAARKERELELEEQSNKMRSHDLIAERRSQLEAQIREKADIIKAEKQRLAEVESCKSLLRDLEPKLNRLAYCREHLDLLEPRRNAYMEISRQMAAAQASIEGQRRATDDNERKLLKLRSDASLLEDLRAQENEHGKVQELLQNLESLRDRHFELQNRQKEEALRLESINSNLAKTKEAIADLHRSRSRLAEILPARDEMSNLRIEQSDLALEREKQVEKDRLLSVEAALEGRKAALEDQLAGVARELEILSGLEEQEALLRKQDKDLDRLSGELNGHLADIKGRLKVQELAMAEAKANLAKVRALGSEGTCPTCERPLMGQSDLLLEKYKAALSHSDKEIATISGKMKDQMAKIDGVALSRSNLSKLFDDLNAKKSHRSALFADWKNLKAQLLQINSELAEIHQKIEPLGEVRFEPLRMAEVEAALERLSPLTKECARLEVRLEELVRHEGEEESLESEKANHESRLRDFEDQIRILGYAESDFLDAKRRLSALKPQHDRFLSILERVQEIPLLMEKQALQQQDMEKALCLMQKLQSFLTSLCFDPSEYDAMQRERKSLSKLDEEAQRIKIRVAAQPDVLRRLDEALAAKATLENSITLAEKELVALAYNRQAHEAAKTAQALAEKEMEQSRKEVSERKVVLGVFNSDLIRLKSKQERRKDHERMLADTDRRLEVVETTRYLINDFMDQVLIRVRKDIARTASEILEEVSGKYSLLKIDDDFNILVEDGGEYYPISRYSGGEIDMIAVSVRVAISEYLMRFGPEGETYSFLIFDEIFGSQDQEHREKMIQMLRSLEQRFPQIIAISHISDVQGQFDNTLMVVEDEMGNSRVEAL